MGGQACRRCGQVHGATAACPRVSRHTLVSDEALVGSVVDERYSVTEIMGAGTTGTVFAVTHASYARAAVMKVLRPNYATADAVKRVFYGEVRAALTVVHPGLCEVFDIGTLPDGAPFLVMERLEGDTLASRLGRGPLPVAAAVDLTLQLLSAVAAIHERDLLVRDLRPENVFFAHRRGCRPVVKILDLGLARLAPLDRIREEWERSQATGASAAGRTLVPYYLSPERVRSENDVEPSSDLFLVGILLYEALTGERPFSGATFADLVREIAAGEPMPLRRRDPALPAALEGFLARVLAPNPADRPATASEMQDELRALQYQGEGPAAGMMVGLLDDLGEEAPSPTTRRGAVNADTAAVEVEGAVRPVLDDDVAPTTDVEPALGPLRAVAVEDTVDGSDTTERSTRDLVAAGLPRLSDEEDLTTAAAPVDRRALKAHLAAIEPDEASAENSERTVPPPRPSEAERSPWAGAAIEPEIEASVDRAIELMQAAPPDEASTAITSSSAPPPPLRPLSVPPSVSRSNRPRPMPILPSAAARAKAAPKPAPAKPASAKPAPAKPAPAKPAPAKPAPAKPVSSKKPLAVAERPKAEASHASAARDGRDVVRELGGDEDTETMKLTPDLRQRISQMMGDKPPPAPELAAVGGARGSDAPEAAAPSKTKKAKPPPV